MAIENYYLFVISAFLFIITPGMDTFFVVNNTLNGGKKAGLSSAFGVNTGILIHTLFAGLGLTALLSNSPNSIQIIKYMGGIYLIYLGISSLKIMKVKENKSIKQQSKRQKGGFLGGLITNTLNPKVALFFIAFFPQFINPQAENQVISFFALGITYAIMGVIWYAFLSLFIGTFSEKILQNEKNIERTNKITGSVFLLMGIGFLVF